MDFLKDYKIISIKNFYDVNLFQRLNINYEIENNYKKYYNPKLSYNFKIKEYKSDFFDNLYDKFLTSCNKIFGNFTISEKNRKTCWCYKSSKNNFNSLWHNHEKTSTINGVYYYQIQNGDSISFLDKNNNELKYFLVQNELLIFPNYLIHKPNIPINNFFNKNRYSINVEIITKETSKELFNRI